MNFKTPWEHATFHLGYIISQCAQTTDSWSVHWIKILVCVIRTIWKWYNSTQRWIRDCQIGNRNYTAVIITCTNSWNEKWQQIIRCCIRSSNGCSILHNSMGIMAVVYLTIHMVPFGNITVLWLYKLGHIQGIMKQTQSRHTYKNKRIVSGNCFARQCSTATHSDVSTKCTYYVCNISEVSVRKKGVFGLHRFRGAYFRLWK